MDIREQFLTKIEWIEDSNTGCWEAEQTSNGEGYSYGTFRVNKKAKRIALHRLSYIVFNGEIPDGHCVMHKCDNRKCINPLHLKTGTKKENTQDMIQKGRVCRDGKVIKLSRDNIIDIRNSNLSSYELAKKYSVSATHVRRIRRGERCKNIV
jgi:hypothetical protein